MAYPKWNKQHIIYGFFTRTSYDFNAFICDIFKSVVILTGVNPYKAFNIENNLIKEIECELII